MRMIIVGFYRERKDEFRVLIYRYLIAVIKMRIIFMMVNIKNINELNNNLPFIFTNNKHSRL